jgi:predicted amidophosphoribosyltransferase
LIHLNWISRLLLGIAFPVPCAICSHSTPDPLCEACFKSLRHRNRCILCLKPLGVSGCKTCSKRLGIDGFKALSSYDELGKWILFTKMEEFPPTLFPWWEFLPGEFTSAKYDLIFIPSSKGDHWMENGLPDELRNSLLSALDRNPSKLSQKLLNRKERKENGVNLFIPRDDFEKGSKKALLIDDVMSTGTSMRTCVSLLRSLGYQQIYGFILAFQNLRDRSTGYNANSNM